MTCNNVILAQPAANSTINHTIPEGDSARLNFGPEDISGLQLSDTGALVISFVDGGQLILSNFQDLTNTDSLIYLADGTLIDPSVLTSALQAPDVLNPDNNLMDALEPVTIAKPTENTNQKITLSEGQKYICDFDPVNEAVVEIKDGQMILTFADGSQVTLDGYSEMMAGVLPPALTLADGSVLDAEELLTDVLDLNDLENEVASIEETDVANIEPAAGDGADDEVSGEEDMAALAQQLADVQPAAGGDTGSGGNSGYGFNSKATEITFNSPDAIGAINATALKYEAPDANQETFLADAIPVISPSTSFLDETDLSGDGLIAVGKLSVNYGSDAPGTITINGQTSITGSVANGTLTSGGVPVVFSQTDTGFVGTVNGNTIFTFTIDSNGNFEYTQSGSFDHADSDDPNDTLFITFGVVATDADGDRTSSSVRIAIADDAPEIFDSTNNIDEKDLSAGSVTQTGTLDPDFNADGDGSIAPNGDFSADGSLDNGELSHNGVAITVTQTADGYIGKAGDLVVFELVIDLMTGEYTFIQHTGLDHADNNSDDIITLEFGAVITDFDGDTDTSTITINIIDSAPELYTDGTSIGNGEEIVDEADLESGPLVETGNVDASVGGDGPALFAGGSDNLPTGIVSQGLPVTVTFNPVTNTYTGATTTSTVFTLEIDSTSGDYIYTQNSPIDHEVNGNGVDSLALEFDVIVFDNEGESGAGVITINIQDDNPEISTKAQGANEVDLKDGPIVIENKLNHDFGADGAGNIESNGNVMTLFEVGGQNQTLTSDGNPIVITQTADGYVGVANGTTIFSLEINAQTGEYTYTQFENVDHPSTDGVGTDDVILVKFGVTITDGDGDTADAFVQIDIRDDGPIAADDTAQVSNAEQKATGNVLTNDDFGADGGANIIQNPGTYTGEFGTLVIAADGSYTYTRAKDASGVDNFVAGGVDKFTYSIVDGDGDISSATLSVMVADDASPIAINGVGATDDTNVDGAAKDVETGKINVNYQGDAAGTTAANGSFASSGNQAGALSSNGNNVNVKLSGNTYTGTAGGKTVFTMTINANSTYTFEQYEPFDHSNTNSNNEALFLKFGVTATDGDGDIGDGIVTITVRDDGPAASNDTAQLSAANQKATGNVLTNDDFGADGGSTVHQPGTYTGNFGTLVIAANGSYTYTRAGNAGGVDKFTYSIVDGDGDISSATLSVNVVRDTSPIAINGVGATDDTNVDGAAKDVETGKINVDYQGNGAGAMSANGAFSSSGYQAGALSSNGNNISVTLSGNTYTGTAGGKTIFKMTINSNGTYRFEQYEAVDHSYTASNNEALFLKFGVTATDGDGDTGRGTVTITVRDDGPIARNDSNSATASTDKVNGNVLTNDDAGADGGAAVVRFNVGGTWYNAGRTVNTSLGSIKVNTNGTYTFDVDRTGISTSTTTSVIRTWIRDSLNGPQTMRDWVKSEVRTERGGNLKITYEIRDGDGDKDTANLSINVAPVTTSRVIDRGTSGDWSSPLVLDLDDDGIELTNVNDGVLFDFDNDGELEQTAWVKSDDGLLAMDRDGDGLITDRTELFGDTNGATDGFDRLDDLDTNQDGAITAEDDDFENLLVWRDLNQDGVSDAEELFSLDQIGIVSLSLNADLPEGIFIEGNWISHVSSYVTADDETHELVDAWFQYSNLDVDDTLFTAINESADTLSALDQAEEISLDISLMLEGEDDVTNSIQNFVYSADDADVVSDNFSGSNALDIRPEDLSGSSVADFVSEELPGVSPADIV